MRNKNTNKQQHTRHQFRLKPAYAAVLLAFTVQTVEANPLDPAVVSGQASFATSGSTLTVTNTPGAIINWQGFSIGANEITRFNQQSASSAVLNRVISSNPSSILGALQSNGRVFLINPNGIVFGAGAVVDVAGLVASTLNLSDADFIAGNHHYTEIPGAAKISNAGNITAQGDGQGGGQIFLIAPDVENTGVITAPNGEILLAAGYSVDLVSTSDPDLRVSITAPAGDATNVGKLIAESGSLGLFGTVVRNSGSVSADSATLQGGKIVFRASQRVEAGGTITANGASGGSVDISADHSADPIAPGVVFQTGSIAANGSAGAGGAVNISSDSILSTAAINADGTTAGGQINVQANNRALSTSSAQYTANSTQGQGGDILVSANVSNYTSGSYTATGDTGGNLTIAGDEIKLASAQLDASGTHGGGSIRVGGLMHGATGFSAQGIALGNATSVIANSATSFKADAVNTGNGGEVVLWSDQAMSFGGNISARGGAQGGNGGMAEVSGLTSLFYAGLTDLSASLGSNGTLLLDPRNITIVSGSTAGVPTASVTTLIDPTPGAGNSFGSSVTELANGNIVVTSPYDDLAAQNAGAAYLYSPDGLLVSALTGSAVGDNVGLGGVTALSNGNYVVNSYYWTNNGAAPNTGAVTWASGSSGISGVVDATNSLVGSAASDQVGFSGITALSNGNYVVNSPYWDNSTAATNAGAVTWANGSGGTVGTIGLSNSLVGSTAGDMVGYWGVTALSNGNYLVRSDWWDNGAATDAGAVTWGDGATAGTRLVGAVSASNSLVGSTAFDNVGSYGITKLSNGNYVVNSPNWDSGAVVDAGAVTWGSGTSGVSGVISVSNSLVGSSTSDVVGNYGITALSNGNYVVTSTAWDNGTVIAAGAVTWGSGISGVSGVISSANSLVGSSTNDTLGLGGIIELSNGNYVVRSQNWNNNMGAVTWGDGDTGITGAISAANSLVGSTANDNVGNYGITKVGNGNYVVNSPYWANGAETYAGAVTWVDGATGKVSDYAANSNQNLVSATNSLVGSTSQDLVGYWGVTALSNGNYVVDSPFWTNGTALYAGAVTWGDGTTGITGAVSVSNSLVGSAANDYVGYHGVTALSNGNYVVASAWWDNGTVVDVGAVTWGNGTTGITGAVSASNSLVGSSIYDNVGSGGVTVLSNGNYVVSSQWWDNGTAGSAGAVTWGNGATGITGAVSASNSLVGSSSDDQVGSDGVIALSNGNYVVDSTYWTNGTALYAGAVTWGNGTTGITGAVSASNSLVGSTENDNVGSNGITVLGNSNYVVRSSNWDNSTVVDAGAVTWGSGTAGVKGAVSAANSLVGSSKYDYVGSDGITELGNSNYVVRSYNWDNGTVVDAGALTWGNGSGGTVGTITSANSVAGKYTNEYYNAYILALNGAANLGKVLVAVPDDSRSGLAGAGSVFILGAPVAGMPASGTLFADTPGSDLTIGADNIAATLNTGTNVVLQANNDITQSSGAAIVATGEGDLSLQAGRSVILNDVIDIRGALNITANDAGANQTYRLLGTAVIDTHLADLTADIVNMTNSGGNILAGAIWTRIGDIDLTAANNIDIAGELFNDTGGDVVLRSDMNGTGIGTITFGASGSISLAGGRADLFYNSVSYTDATTKSDSTYNPYTSYMGVTTYTAWMLVNDVGLETGGTLGLQAMGTNLAGNYALGRDIDASATVGWNGGDGFVPVGDTGTNFTGGFNGLDHTISGLTIYLPSANNVGLFGYLGTGAVVSHVGLQNANVTGVDNVGGLAGYNGGIINNSYVRGGTVTGTNSVGGLVGYNATGSGSFNGTSTSYVGATISNSYVDTGTVVNGTTYVGGLAGWNDGSIIGSSVHGSEVYGTTDVGGLVGHNALGNSGSGITFGFNGARISNSYVDTGTVVNGQADVGGLAGYNDGYIGYSYVSTSDVIGSGVYVGGLVGFNNLAYTSEGYSGGRIYNSYVSGGTVTGLSSVGGLVGYNFNTSNGNHGGLIINSYASGGTVSGSSYAGGLVGSNIGKVSNSYASNGNVYGGGYVGGLAGNNAYGGSISNSYVSGGSVDSSATDSGWVGGLAGFNAGTITTSYASTGVINPGGYYGFGGLVGNNAGSVTNGFWDIDVSGTATGIGAGTTTGATGIYSSTTTIDAFMQATYTGFDFTPGTGAWFMIDGGTRPFLQSEWSTGTTTTITNAHQLQMMVMDPYASYTLGSDIDMSETASGTGMWSAAGFVPVYFNGKLDGQGHTINDLFINLPSSYYVGLFSTLDYGAVVHDVGLVGGSVSGFYYVGGLAGQNNGTISNSYVSGMTVSGNWMVGGLVGYNNGTIDSSHVGDSTISGGGGSYIGGLAGYNNGFIYNSYVSGGSVTGSSRVGGLVGYNNGNIDSSHVSDGDVSGSSSVGGLVGENNNGTISNSYVDTGTVVNGGNYVGGLLGYGSGEGVIQGNTVTGNTIVNGNDYVGGLLGYDGGEGAITGNTVTGATVNGNSYVGGLAGKLSQPYITGYADNNQVINSFVNGGVVSGGSYVGGLVGWNGMTITNSSVSDTSVTATNSNTSLDAGGLVGYNAGSISNSYVSGGTVSGIFGYYVGGLVGENNGNISNSYVSGVTVDGSSSYDVGGLVGYNSGSIDGSYVSGADVSGSSSVGGLVGYNSGTVSNSYVSSGIVGGNWGVGGLIGWDNGSIDNSHYDVDGVTINGVNAVTEFGLYSVQYLDWFNGGLLTPLDIANYTGSLPGSAGSYTISNLQGMKDMIGFADAGYTFTLTSNITLPAGYNVPYFFGTFDGGGNTLSGLNVDLPNYDIGLFGYVAVDSNISNVSLLDPVVTGYSDVGALAGYNDGSISNSYVSGGAVTGASNVGGLVGYNDQYGGIVGSYVNGDTVTGVGIGPVGGLVGTNNFGNISDSHVDGVVVNASGLAPSGSSPVGGLVGYSNSGSISNSYVSNGSVTGVWGVGGMVGNNSLGSITNSYVSNVNVDGAFVVGGLAGFNSGTISDSYVGGGTVSGSDAVGGLAGFNAGSINNTYASGGTVSGTGNVGGVVGYNDSYGGAVVSNSFWNTDTAGAGVTSGIGYDSTALGGTDSGAVGKITAELMTMSTFSGAGWNIANTSGAGATWRIYEGYTAPLLTSFLSPLTVTLGNDSKTYDGLAYAGGGGGVTYSDVNAPSSGTLSGTLYGGSANGAVNAGSYVISASGLYSSQLGYDISYVDGTLTVNTASLSVTATDASKTYDSFAFSGGNGVTYTGFVNGETSAVLGGTLTYGGNSQGAINAGSYLITPGGYSSGNYTISYVDGVLTISPATVTLNITANDASKTYGTTLTFNGTEFVPVGLQGSDAISGVTLTSLGAVDTANAGTYAITPGSAVFSVGNAGNYIISYVDGVLTVTPANITIAADAATKVYGDADPALTFTASGLMSWDTNATAFTGALARTAGENVATGPYAINAGTLASTNYSFTGITTNNLIITPAPLTVTANNTNKILNTTDPLLTYMVSGLKLSDTEASTLSGALSRAAGETVGTYQINQGTLALLSTNYTMTYVPGSFTILVPTVINEIVNTSLLFGPDTGSSQSTSSEDDEKAAEEVVVVADTTTGEGTAAPPLPVCN